MLHPHGSLDPGVVLESPMPSGQIPGSRRRTCRRVLVLSSRYEIALRLAELLDRQGYLGVPAPADRLLSHSLGPDPVAVILAPDIPTEQKLALCVQLRDTVYPGVPVVVVMSLLEGAVCAKAEVVLRGPATITELCESIEKVMGHQGLIVHWDRGPAGRQEERLSQWASFAGA